MRFSLLPVLATLAAIYATAKPIAVVTTLEGRCDASCEPVDVSNAILLFFSAWS